MLKKGARKAKPTRTNKCALPAPAFEVLSPISFSIHITYVHAYTHTDLSCMYCVCVFPSFCLLQIGNKSAMRINLDPVFPVRS